MFGAFGEVALDVEGLIRVVAEVGSRQHCRAMRRGSAAEAKEPLAWVLRRRWALTEFRHAARLKLERFEFV